MKHQPHTRLPAFLLPLAVSAGMAFGQPATPPQSETKPATTAPTVAGSATTTTTTTTTTPPPANPAAAAVEQPPVLVIGEALGDPQRQPVSATFLTERDVENFRIREPQDIVRIVPNMSATDSGSRSFGDVYSVRGLTNTVFFGAPATTIYVDDVPFGETFTFAQQLSAINSVEVLRGPQPTVVGRNTYGGLINIRSLRPTNDFDGDFRYAYGSYESHDADGWVSGPLLADTLHFRLGGQFDSREGYLRNTLNGDRVDDQEHWGLNGGLFFTPAPGWDISLTGGYDEYNDGAPRLTALDRTGDFYSVSSNVDGAQHREVDYQALRIAYENAAWRFLSVTSRRNWDLSPYITDLDFSPADFGSSIIYQDQEIWSQEFRFSSNDPSSDFQWNVGAYGSLSDIHGTGIRNIFTQQRTITRTDITAETAAGIYDATAAMLPFPIPFSVSIPSVILTSVSDSDIAIQQITRHHIKEESLAFFAGGSWSGWDPVTLHGGVRVDWIHREMDRTKTSDTDVSTRTVFQPIAPFSANLGPFIGSQQIELPGLDPFITPTRIKENSGKQHYDEEWVHVTPIASIDVKLNDDVMVYARTTYAFKPGGFSAYVDDPRYVEFDEEKVWASEIGVKAVWLGGKAVTNFAAFYNDVEDYQVERSIGVTDYAVFNAAKAETYGVEFEGRIEVLPILDLSGSIGWTHARLKDYTDPVTGRNLDGKVPPFVPEFDAAVAADFHLESGAFARLEFLALGNTKFDDFNREEFQQDSFGLLNAAVGWRARNWSIALYATNLTEEEYYTNMNTDVRTGAPGAPREFGVRIGVKF
jgi:iron complex outermembrane receptor protein